VSRIAERTILDIEDLRTFIEVAEQVSDCRGNGRKVRQPAEERRALWRRSHLFKSSAGLGPSARACFQTVAFVTQHSSLRLPEASYRERNRSIARASESVQQKERGY
jgi:hypothetical protein